jgi:hypothetical protein
MKKIFTFILFIVWLTLFLLKETSSVQEFFRNLHHMPYLLPFAILPAACALAVAFQTGNRHIAIVLTIYTVLVLCISLLFGLMLLNQWDGYLSHYSGSDSYFFLMRYMLLAWIGMAGITLCDMYYKKQRNKSALI